MTLRYPETVKIAHGLTLLTDDRLDVLAGLAKQCLKLRGMYVECGVYRGGSALMLAEILRGSDKTLYLYDNFGAGLPAPGPHDQHKQGEFGGNRVEDVAALMPSWVQFHPGMVPDTMNQPQYFVAFAHLDLDLYESTLGALESVYRRMVPGGVIVLDDFTMPDCKGVAVAVNEFFADKKEYPLVLETGQAVVMIP